MAIHSITLGTKEMIITIRGGFNMLKKAALSTQKKRPQDVDAAPQSSQTPGTANSSRIDDYVQMSLDDVERFLAEMKAKGRTKDTLSRYRHDLELLYRSLPEGKLIRRGTLADWRVELQKSGYSVSSLNVIFTACDRFLAFLGHRELQLGDRLTKEDTPQPGLTRSEYLRLLSAAKAAGDERLYLIIKTLACTGLRISELPQLTVNNVKAGRFPVSYQGITRIIHIPDCLGGEYLAYVERQGIKEGQVFVNEKGSPLNRSQITVMISKLCQNAQVPAEKGNPRCLQKLYQTTYDGIQMNMQVLLEQAMDRQVEQEQLFVGWET